MPIFSHLKSLWPLSHHVVFTMGLFPSVVPLPKNSAKKKKHLWKVIQPFCLSLITIGIALLSYVVHIYKVRGDEPGPVFSAVYILKCLTRLMCMFRV